LFSSDIRETFGLSHGEFGWVYMMATLASAAMLILVGKVVDHAPVAVVGAVYRSQVLFGL